MNNETNSSPLQRLGIFFLGLFTFVGFGFFAWVFFLMSGGDSDSNYEMKSQARAEKIKEMVTAQSNSVVPNDADLENFVQSSQNKEPKVSQKAVPGTKAFSDWMAAKAAAQSATTKDEIPETIPSGVDQKLIELKISALADPPGTMKFKEAKVEVVAGTKVSLTFTNPDVLQHNLVIVKQGKKEAVGALADAMLTDPEALKKNYVPESEDVIVSSKLVNPGGTEKIEFLAPTEPGEYPYICTFPGHWRLMEGILTVIPSDTKGTPDKIKSEQDVPAEKTEDSEEVVELKINALADPPGTMKFKETELELKAGTKVSLTFTNPDVLQHNLVIVKQGKKEAVGALADAMLTDPEALKKHYVPDSQDIIASTKLINPGGFDKIEFTVPSETGDYSYICTFPGHWRLMQGKIKVTK